MSRREAYDVDPKDRLAADMRVLRRTDLARGTVLESRASSERHGDKGARVVVRLDSGETVEGNTFLFEEALPPPLVRMAEIPKFTNYGNHSFDVHMGDLENQLLGFGNDYEVVLEPDYQRGHVWDDAKRTAFVEYLLRGGRERRDILWNSPGYADGRREPVELVDGLQRVTAMRLFMQDRLPAFGQTFGRFHPEDRARIALSTTLTFKFHVNDLPDRASVLAWYLELNTGGVVHTDAEIARVRAMLDAERGKTA